MVPLKRRKNVVIIEKLKRESNAAGEHAKNIDR
jgi:hypothetical protein